MTDESESMILLHVKNLLNGHPVSEVPTNLLPKVHSVLNAAKTNAIGTGDVEKVRILQSIIKQINFQSSMGLSSRKSSRLPSINNGPEAHLKNSVDVLESTLNEILDGLAYDHIDTELLPDLIIYSKKKADILTQQRKLLDAQRHDNIHKDLINVSYERKSVKSLSNKKQIYENQITLTQQSLEAQQNMMEEDLIEHEKKIHLSIDKAEEEWAQFLIDFDKQTDEGLPAKYKKLSPNLLNLREKERFLIQMRRFEEAQEVANEADVIEEQEMIILQKNYLLIREQQKNNAASNHEQKIKCLQQNGERVRQKIIAEHQIKIESFQRSIINLQNKIKRMEAGIQSVPPTPLPSRPLSPKRQKSTFVTQTLSQYSQSNIKASKTPQRKTPMTRFRPQTQQSKCRPRYPVP